MSVKKNVKPKRNKKPIKSRNTRLWNVSLRSKRKRTKWKLAKVVIEITERVIRGLEVLKVKPGKSRIMIDVLKKLYKESRLKERDIEREIKFNELAYKLNIKLIKGPKKSNLILQNISAMVKILKCRAFWSELPHGIKSLSRYVNIETINIISFDMETNENKLLVNKSNELFPTLKQLTLPYF